MSALDIGLMSVAAAAIVAGAGGVLGAWIMRGVIKGVTEALEELREEVKKLRKR